MKQYNRIYLGKGGMYAEQCHQEGYIGANFNIYQDLTGEFTENWRDFNKKYIPVCMAGNPEKSKTAAGLHCGYLWTMFKGLKIGDVVLCPSGKGFYYVGVINGYYYYVEGEELQHRRNVKWLDKIIYKKDMSVELRNSSGAIGTCCNISKYAAELESLISEGKQIAPTVKDGNVKPSEKKEYHERELHKLFCTSLRNEDIYAKTIYHEQTPKKNDASMKWVHPDIVGAKFEDIENEATLSLLKTLEPKETVNVYSFEMKKKIENDSQLKEYYFQALSNSSWANYGYLVAFDVNESLQEEMARLNSTFGIGIIQLNTADYKVLYPAKEHPLDFRTIEKLAKNPNFEEFIKKLSKYLNAPKNYTTDAKRTFEDCCDEIFSKREDIDDYCKNHNIPIL